MNTIAPVALFVYNRYEHTIQTVEALLKNRLAKETELYIYSDAAANAKEASRVSAVRNYIHSLKGFKKIEIIEKTKNYGLAKSIIAGVTEVIDRHGKVIVLEDDLTTSSEFLTFMNRCLDFYEDKENVWHISGWNYPIPKVNNADVFFWHTMNCWGWATWKDRWQHFEKDPEKLIKTFSKDDIHRFNVNGTSNFWNQVTRNYRGKIDTWAIFWYATIFKNKGYCLNPVESFVINTGLDGSGENWKDVGITYNTTTNTKSEIELIDTVAEDPHIMPVLHTYLKKQNKGIFLRGVNFISRKLIGKNIV